MKLTLLLSSFGTFSLVSVPKMLGYKRKKKKKQKIVRVNLHNEFEAVQRTSGPWTSLLKGHSNFPLVCKLVQEPCIGNHSKSAGHQGDCCGYHGLFWGLPVQDYIYGQIVNGLPWWDSQVVAVLWRDHCSRANCWLPTSTPDSMGP